MPLPLPRKLNRGMRIHQPNVAAKTETLKSISFQQLFQRCCLAAAEHSARWHPGVRDKCIVPLKKIKSLVLWASRLAGHREKKYQCQPE